MVASLEASIASEGGRSERGQRLGQWIYSVFGWLVRKEVLLASLCERKIMFRLEIYDRLRQATAKRTGYIRARVGSRRGKGQRVGLGGDKHSG